MRTSNTLLYRGTITDNNCTKCIFYVLKDYCGYSEMLVNIVWHKGMPEVIKFKNIMREWERNNLKPITGCLHELDKRTITITEDK